jgi:RimJ/RimL family protein N-acetyltransferase
VNIKVEKFDINDPVQVEAFVQWDCDKELYHLATPNRDEEMSLTFPTRGEVLKKYQDPNFSKGVYMIWDGIKPIGNLSIMIDPPHLMKKIKGTSWLGLIIGERDYWGTGAAREAMTFFEEESLRLGLTRARRFFEGLGYYEIGRLQEFTYFDGRLWDDIRMEKMLK